MENENVLPETTTQEEVLGLNQETSQVDVNALIEQNRKLYARAKTAEAKLKTSTEQKPITRQEEPKSSLTEDKIWEVADLIRQGYTRKDAEFLMSNGGTKALEDPNSYASIALKTVMEQRRAEQAASQTSSGTGGDTSMPLPEEKMREMSSTELEKILPKS